MPNTHTTAHSKRRAFKDRLAGYFIMAVSLWVILLVFLMVGYFFQQSLPLFSSATLGKPSTINLIPQKDGFSHYLLGPENQTAVRLEHQKITGFDLSSGRELFETRWPFRAQKIVQGGLQSSIFWLLGTGGQSLFYQAKFNSHYLNNKIEITPSVLRVFKGAEPKIPKKIILASFRNNQEKLLAILVTPKKVLSFAYTISQKPFEKTPKLTSRPFSLPNSPEPKNIQSILIDDQLSSLVFINKNGTMDLFSIEDPSNVLYVGKFALPIPENQKANILDSQWLFGSAAFLTLTEKGHLYRTNLIKGERPSLLINELQELPKNPTGLRTIANKRDYAVFYPNGRMIYRNTTSKKTIKDTNVLPESLPKPHLEELLFSPKNNQITAIDSKNQFHNLTFDNQNSEISFTALFKAVAYEGYKKPSYVWQSTGGNDYESKFSLIPLILGTLKAAIYATLIAIPLGVLSAIYTGYFMSPPLRKIIKPTIELIAALPTVILGFFAGLILAPWLSHQLFFLLTLAILFLPLMVTTGFLTQKLLNFLKIPLQEGTQLLLSALSLILWIYPLGYLCSGLESLWFGGDFVHYLSETVGIPYNQRNALVVAVAMGFAVTPIIFSITEDAIFHVPKALSLGSFALGASKWQTAFRIILPTASPAILSSIMIGLGRAVGETMIILMASGNTPVLNWLPLDGLRSLSANIAIETPEAVLGSSHYRVLFFSGLLLFLFTFIMNGLSEWVRNILYQRYRSL